ncbi:MAG: hypothetical protein AB2L07_09075 [Thermoanaerobaculaceae bacterium]
MPVRRCRSVAEMPPIPPLSPLSAEALHAACELSALAWRLHPVRLEPGVRKLRSVENASARRAWWEREHLRSLV